MSMKMRMKSILVLWLLFGGVQATTIDTWPAGAEAGQAIILDNPWTLDVGPYTDYAKGAVAMKNGLHIINSWGSFYGDASLGVLFPIQKKIIVEGSVEAGRIYLLTDLHLSESTSLYAQNSYGSFSVESTDLQTIYLDGDVSIEQGWWELTNVVIDGQGHTLTIASGVQLDFFGITLRNLVLKVLSGASVYFDRMSSMLENMEIRPPAGSQMAFTLSNDRTLTIRGTVKFGNFCDYFVGPYTRGGSSSPCYIAIEQNANLIVENSTLTRRFADPALGVLDDVELSFIFGSKNAYLTLDNSTFGDDDQGYSRWGYVDHPMKLKQGTVVVKGKSTIKSTTDLAYPYQVPIIFGDGVDANNDINFKIESGATLALESTSTRGLIVLNNVH